MIERYSISAPPEKVKERFSIEVPEYYTPRFNAAPTQLLPVITISAPEGISLFYWGQPPDWAKNKTPAEKIINVRTETIAEKPALKKAMLTSRCIVPADGFYGWKKVGKKTAIPYRFIATNQEIFSMAGLWEEFEDNDGSQIQTFTLLTITSNEVVRNISERMPVLLDKSAEKKWLNPESTENELISILTPYEASKMNHYPVSPRINMVGIDVPSLIIPTPPTDQFGNLTLFD
ncbi:MAG: SOS response-associated peptidase [Cyclobacteriaceae bacterium]|nr:SOS response-associated peptidase [Cyclobacteriaceae bacterium]